MKKKRIFSEEWRRKLSEAKKGKPSNWKGKSPSEQARLKMRNAKLGNKQTKETRNKNRESQLARFKSRIPNYIPYAWQDRRKEKLRNSDGSHSAGEWETLKAQYNWTCPSCKRKDLPLTRDHIIPVSKGGSDNIENIQPLCRSCNSKKNSNTIKY